MACGKDELVAATAAFFSISITSDIPTFAQSSLYALHHTFGLDLVLADEMSATLTEAE